MKKTTENSDNITETAEKKNIKENQTEGRGKPVCGGCFSSGRTVL